MVFLMKTYRNIGLSAITVGKRKQSQDVRYVVHRSAGKTSLSMAARSVAAGSSSSERSYKQRP
jgi:hypothetical protein